VGNNGGTHTYITLKDDESPNGVKHIHANSNVVGFLSGGGTWLSYWTDAGAQQNTGSITAPAFYYSSDERLKKNIETISNSKALRDILALNPVTYDWKDKAHGEGSQLGFIAQEVEKVVPELVTTDASSTMKAVDYARIAPLLVGAIQAQQAQIDELKAEVKALKAAQQ
jgi:NAD(P)H-dependent flavin oxidoreductase YrpB (nitropropane dioxygenase family)